MPASSTQCTFFWGLLPQSVQRAMLAASQSEPIGQMLDSAMMKSCCAVHIGGLDRVPDRFGPFACMHAADKTGFELLESLQDTLPRAGVSAAQGGQKFKECEMRILLTGHKGYIGAVAGPLLCSSGHEVIGLDTDLFAGCEFGDIAPDIPEVHKD